MKFSTLILIIFIALPAIVYSQSNYKAGYIIKLNRDTIKGYINYREWGITPKKIEFKNSLSDKNITVYKPNEISAFGLSNLDKYISYIGPVTNDPNVFPNLPVQLDTTSRTDTLFLQFLYEANPVSLLAQRDKEKPRFFVIVANGTPIELKFHQYYVQAQQVAIIAPYMQTLAKVAATQNRLTKIIELNIDRSKFTESDLLKLVKLINNDKSKSSSGTSGSRFYAGILFNSSKFKIEGNDFFNETQSTSYIPRLTAGFDFFTNKHTQRLILRGELSISMAKINLQPASKNNSYKYKYNFNQYTASLSPQLLYSFYSAEKIKVYAGVGVSLNLSKYSKSNQATLAINSVTVLENYTSLLNYWFNYPVKAGVVFNNKLDLNFLYSPPASFTNMNYYSINNTVYAIGLNYRFGK